MWIAVCLVALTAVPPAEIAPGIRVRLGAGSVVNVPGLYSSERGRTTFSRPSTEDESLLWFTRENGTREIVLRPMETVEGTLVAAEGLWIELIRKGQGSPDRVRRASVARVEVATGRQGGGAMKGLGIGAGVGLGIGLAGLATTSGAPDGPARAMNQGFLVVAGVLGGAIGLAVGAVDDVLGGEVWQEVPLEALDAPGDGGDRHRVSAALAQEGPGQVEAGSWMVVSVGDGPEAAITLVPAGPLRRSVAELGRGRPEPGSTGAGARQGDTPSVGRRGPDARE